MGIFDKAVDKVEKSVGEAREKTGLAPDDETQIPSDTDTNKANDAPTDETLKDA